MSENLLQAASTFVRSFKGVAQESKIRSQEKSLRIALFHNSPGGGSLRAIRYLIQGLIARGHQIECFLESGLADRENDLESKAVFHGYEFPQPPEAPVNIQPYLFECFAELRQLCGYMKKYRRANAKIARDINKGNFDVVWVDKCHVTSSPFVLGHLQAPSVYYCQEPLRDGYEGRVSLRESNGPASRFFLKRIYGNLCESLISKRFKDRTLIDRENARKANLIVTNSAYTKEYIRQAYGAAAQVSYLGVDTSIFKPLGMPRERMVLSVGRLEKRKRHSLAIQALGLLNESIRPRLVIVAEYENKVRADELEELARRSQVSLQILYGIADEELVSLYNKAMAVTYTAMREPFGLVALEAMACGTPIIGVREGGLQESIKNEVTGYLVQPSPEDVADALCKISGTKGLTEKLGRQGVESVREFWTWDAAAARFETCLRQAIEEGPAHG